MTDVPPPLRAQPSHADRLLALLRGAGVADAVADTLIEVDAANFQFVRRVLRGDVPSSLIDEIGAGLEGAQFHALAAIARIESGHGRAAPEEVTVGLLAGELMVDPSRASRVASDLVERGLVARAVSQADGRRSVLRPTAEGRALLEAFVGAKWQRMLRVFADWPEEDILAFGRLFVRFAEGMHREYPPRGGAG